jgi:D-alanine-D-alanine ligase
MAQRITVLLLFGGESPEHTVSVSSARNVFAALDEIKFDVFLGYIDKTGKWWLLESFDQINNTNDTMQLVPVLGTRNLKTLDNSKSITPDVILPILHGENGEDGTVQGLAKLLHIPIVGCQIAASAICIDKVLAKQLLEYGGIRTVPYAVHLAGEPNPDYKILSTELGKTMFVKPARCGSSVGISKIKNQKELDSALIEAHKFDSKLLIEESITARELEVGMLGNIDDVRASGVGEICPDREFYNFESKYDEKSQTKAVIPADISEGLVKEIQTIAIKAYKIVGCEGLSRIDFFLSDDNKLYVNEINTLPGFTNISMYPKLWIAKSMTYPELIEKIIALALKPAII